MRRYPTTEKIIPCVEPERFWLGKTSLAKELSIRSLPVVGEDLHAAYSRLYREHFGKPCYRLDTKRSSKMMVKIQSIIDQDTLNPAMYVSASFHMLSKWFQGRAGRTVYPNMLVGEKAVGRYNAFIRKMNRHQNVSQTALEHSTQIGKVRRLLYRNELEHGHTLLAFARVGNTVLSASLKQSRVDDALLKRLRREDSFGVAIMKRESTTAKIKAAASIAEKQESGLSSKIGFRHPLEWDKFVVLLVRLYQPRPRKESPTFRNVGQHWEKSK